MNNQNKNNQLLFRNPRLRIRRERFGGIVKVNDNVLLLGKKEYSILNTFGHMSKEEAVQKHGMTLIDSFSRHKMLLLISIRNARKILGKKEEKL